MKLFGGKKGGEHVGRAQAAPAAPARQERKQAAR